MPLICAVAALAVVAGSAWFFSGPRKSSSGGSPSVTSGTNSAPASSGVRPEFQKLIGSWVRPDGDYVLQIRGVDTIGVLDAAYFNPDPIHVSKAVVLRDGADTQVFIELKDVNYPGCTYTLVYDPTSDRLTGDYFQAAMQEHFQVEFTRKL